MTHKIPNIDCLAYERGICYHNLAPRKLLMRPECILVSSKDPRIVMQCNLQHHWPKTGYVHPPRKP